VFCQDCSAEFAANENVSAVAGCFHQVFNNASGKSAGTQGQFRPQRFVVGNCPTVDKVSPIREFLLFWLVRFSAGTQTKNPKSALFPNFNGLGRRSSVRFLKQSVLAA
jgi:hypothetical protein